MVMTNVQEAYECAFMEFSKRVREVQRLASQPCADPRAMDAAILELERARLLYDRCRDLMAEELLPASSRHKIRHTAPDSGEVFAERVRGVAELLWEAAGRPEGTADQDWRRAEEIVRRAAVA